MHPTLHLTQANHRSQCSALCCRHGPRTSIKDQTWSWTFFIGHSLSHSAKVFWGGSAKIVPKRITTSANGSTCSCCLRIHNQMLPIKLVVSPGCKFDAHMFTILTNRSVVEALGLICATPDFIPCRIYFCPPAPLMQSLRYHAYW